MTRGPALAGRVVAITRPLDESNALAAQIEAAGGEALVYPALEIAPPPDESRMRSLLDAAGTFDLAIFVSPTAVARAFDYRPAWPSDLDTAAVGLGTARALERHGVRDVIVPAERFDSEGLLDHPRLNAVAGQRVLIVRGQGGRETLADGLRARGATVDYAECYVRAKPAWDGGPLAARLLGGDVLALVVTSSEGLRNVMGRLGPDAVLALARTVVVIPHDRIARDARAAGVTRIAVSRGAGDESVMETLLALAAGPDSGESPHP